MKFDCVDCLSYNVKATIHKDFDFNSAPGSHAQW